MWRGKLASYRTAVSVERVYNKSVIRLWVKITSKSTKKSETILAQVWGREKF